MTAMPRPFIESSMRGAAAYAGSAQTMLALGKIAQAGDMIGVEMRDDDASNILRRDAEAAQLLTGPVRTSNRGGMRRA